MIAASAAAPARRARSARWAHDGRLGVRAAPLRQAASTRANSSTRKGLASQPSKPFCSTRRRRGVEGGSLRRTAGQQAGVLRVLTACRHVPAGACWRHLCVLGCAPYALLARRPSARLTAMHWSRVSSNCRPAQSGQGDAACASERKASGWKMRGAADQPAVVGQARTMHHAWDIHHTCVVQ